MTGSPPETKGKTISFRRSASCRLAIATLDPRQDAERPQDHSDARRLCETPDGPPESTFQRCHCFFIPNHGRHERALWGLPVVEQVSNLLVREMITQWSVKTISKKIFEIRRFPVQSDRPVSVSQIRAGGGGQLGQDGFCQT